MPIKSSCAVFDRRCSQNKVHSLVDVNHSGRLSGPVLILVLDYAERVDPQVPNSHINAKANGVAESSGEVRVRNSLQMRWIRLRSCSYYMFFTPTIAEGQKSPKPVASGFNNLNGVRNFGGIEF